MLSLLQCKIRNNLLNMQMWTVALNQPFCHFGRLGDHRAPVTEPVGETWEKCKVFLQ